MKKYFFMFVLTLFSCSREWDNPFDPNNEQGLNIPTEGLVTYYPFNGNANDESGNGNDGTVNGANLTKDRFGNENSAAVFDGNGDNIRSESNDYPLNNDPFSFIGWFKTNDTGGNNGWSGNVILSYGQPNLVLSIYSGKLYNFTFTENRPGPFVANGEWHYFAIVYDGAQSKTYVDNKLVDTYSKVLVTTSFPLYLGWRNYIPAHWEYNGTIDDIRIFNRAITDEEIQALYHEGGWE